MPAIIATMEAPVKPADIRTHGPLMRCATYAAVGVAIILCIIKIAAWLLTGSVAILSSLVDSLLDLIASGINLVAVRHALTPADHEHRYGHGKAEAIAGLAQAAFITGSSVFLIFEACNRLLHPQAVENSAIGIAVMILTIVLTLLLVQFQRYVIKRTHSVAISADSLHYKGDLLLNASVIVALMLEAYWGWQFADPIFAVLVAGFIFRSAWLIGKQSLAQLMDQELPDAVREEIKSLALLHPQVLNLHELKTRSSGRQHFIQLHLEMDGDLKLREAHQIASDVETAIRASFPNTEVIIHQDMEGLDEGESRE